MRKHLTTFLLITIAMMLQSSSVFAAPAGWELQPCRNWDVVVAVDDEMMESLFVFYNPFPLVHHDIIGAKDYAARQVLRGTWQFYIQFGYTYRVIDFWEWESTDSLTTTDEILTEVVDKLWTKPNGQYKTGSWLDNDRRAVVLVAFTKQQTFDNTAGIAYIADENGSTVNAILISYRTTFVDDNTVMHEISHLHGLDDNPEEEENGSVMDYTREPLIVGYWEPLMPIKKGYALLDLSMWTGALRGAAIHYDWTDAEKEIIEANPNPGDYLSGSSRNDILFEPELAAGYPIGPITPLGVLLFIVNILFVCGALLLLGFGIIKLIKLLRRHSEKFRRYSDKLLRNRKNNKNKVSSET